MGIKNTLAAVCKIAYMGIKHNKNFIINSFYNNKNCNFGVVKKQSSNNIKIIVQ